MSALDELRGGQIGLDFHKLLRRTIRAVAVARNIPAPDGLVEWNDEAVGRVVSDFVADRQTPRRLTDLATTCMSDAALRARLQGTVRNFLSDLGRRTPVGKLVLRINDVLGHNEEFVRVDGRWTFASYPQGAGVSDDDRFERTLASIQIDAPRWGHEARRSAPVADAETVSAMCRSLLEVAGGSLTPRVMAAAIARRVGVGQAPISLDINVLDGGWAETDRALDTTGSEALRPMRAREIVEQLNDRERLAVAFPEYTVRELAPLLGVNRSRAHVIRKRAVAVIKAEVKDDDDGEGIAMEVIDLARKWADEWTRLSSPTF